MKGSPNICTKIENRPTSRHARLKSQNNGEKAKMLQASLMGKEIIRMVSDFLTATLNPDGNSLQISQEKLLYFQFSILYSAYTIFIVSTSG